jgi:hypothetical protein
MSITININGYLLTNVDIDNPYGNVYQWAKISDILDTMQLQDRDWIELQVKDSKPCYIKGDAGYPEFYLKKLHQAIERFDALFFRGVITRSGYMKCFSDTTDITSSGWLKMTEIMYFCESKLDINYNNYSNHFEGLILYTKSIDTNSYTKYYIPYGCANELLTALEEVGK